MFSAYFVGIFLPYFTAIVFVAGIAYRITKWNKAKAAKMTLFPAPNTSLSRWGQILKEVLVFRELFKGNRSLWAGTSLFHASLILIVLGHARVVTDFPLLWKALGMSNAGVDSMSNILGGAAGLIMLSMGVFLLFRRFAVHRVREISDSEDYFILFLILAVVISGDILRFGTDFDLNATRQYFWSLVTIQPTLPPANPYFMLHFFFGQVLIMYCPFSKFLHIPGVFYSKSLLYQQ